MTLPTLINNYQKKQTIAQLKKAYSELSQAIAIAQKDLGMIEDWDFANFPTQADSAQYFYENVLKPNIKIVKYCAPSSNDCWPDATYTLTGTEYIGLVNARQGHNSFITASGYSVHYWLNASGTGGWFFIDLNGSRKPNMLGKDIFVFMLYHKKINDNGTSINLGLHPHGLHANPMMTREDIILGNYPYSVNADSGGCSVTSTRSPGVSCSALIMLDNWEIKDDYPWN